MKTKTTGIPFKDYGADTTAGTEVIKPQHAEYKRTRGPENPSSLLFANVNARLQIVYDVFQQSPAEKKRHFARLYELAHRIFYPIIKLSIAPVNNFHPGDVREKIQIDL